MDAVNIRPESPVEKRRREEAEIVEELVFSRFGIRTLERNGKLHSIPTGTTGNTMTGKEIDVPDGKSDGGLLNGGKSEPNNHFGNENKKKQKKKGLWCCMKT